MYVFKKSHYFKQKLPWKLSIHEGKNGAALTEVRMGAQGPAPNTSTEHLGAQCTVYNTNYWSRSVEATLLNVMDQEKFKKDFKGWTEGFCFVK